MLQVLAVEVGVGLEVVLGRDLEPEVPRTFDEQAGRKDLGSWEAEMNQEEEEEEEEEEARKALAYVDIGAEALTFLLEGVVRAGWVEETTA